jgi:hypothetical protein
VLGSVRSEADVATEDDATSCLRRVRLLDEEKRRVSAAGASTGNARRRAIELRRSGGTHLEEATVVAEPVVDAAAARGMS